jgi:hypothetical protein
VSHRVPEDERAGHHAPPSLLPAPVGGYVVPAPPARVPETWRDLWAAVWRSPVAAVLDPDSDLAPMARLFELYGLDEQYGAAVKRQNQRLAELSAEDFDDLFDTRLLKARLSVAAEIRQVEQTLGITPRGRLVIGAAVAAAGKASAAQQQEARDDADD